MRIGLDARNLMPRINGLGRHVYPIITHLAKLDDENEYIIIKRPEYKSKIVDKENFREVSVPCDPSSLRNCLIGFREINDLRLDIYHCLFHFLPGRIKAQKIMVTLHDLIWVDYPKLAFNGFFRQKIVEYYGKIFIKRAVTKSDIIVAISEHTKEHALRRYNLSAETIHVIRNGIDLDYFNKIALSEVPEEHRKRGYIFSIGHTKPYKNIPRLIHAFKLISDEFLDIDLMVVGRGDYLIKLKNLVAEYGLEKRVIFTGYLPDEVMIPLFKNALFLAFPSLIEGFGAPLLEAMALRCPILSSNIPVIEEIGGDAYEKINPHSAEDIAKGMRKLLSFKDYRDYLRDKGYERAKLFSWEESAKKLLALYKGTAQFNREASPQTLWTRSG
ncbi:MAG: glycosyltransferase family 4 protein [Ignavibacteriales bacterium]